MLPKTKIHLPEVRDETSHVRNVAVIAHVDHGKSTLSDSLVAAAGLMCSTKAGNERYMQSREDEKEKGITIKSSGISLKLSSEGKPYLVNLIDSPGHVDFSSEVSAALRVADGALLVVDCVEGVCVQTETVLNQALQELVQPVLVLNKLDRAILELEMDAEQIYQICLRVIDGVNAVIGASAHPALISKMCPVQSNVIFASGKDSWGFSLDSFATFYAQKSGVSQQKFKEKLWGDHFYDSSRKKFIKNPKTKSSNIERCFVHFVLNPILKLAKYSKKPNLNSNESLQNHLDYFRIKLSKAEKSLSGKKFFKKAVSKWLKLDHALIPLIVHQLPCPKKAQAYRYKSLYTGDLKDQTALSIKNCDSNGPLAIFISKMVPSANSKQFYAFGRVFSGKISARSKVQVILPGNDKRFETTVKRVVRLMGHKVESAVSVSAGHTVGLVGLDEFILKSASIVNCEESAPIREMTYSVSPVVQLAVSAKKPQDTPQLIKGMKLLSKSDPLIECLHDSQTGEHIIAGSGELHLQVCLQDLRKKFAKVEIKSSEPLVSYKESVMTKSQVMLSKSANKHNRFFMTAQPLSKDIVEAYDNKKIFNDSVKSVQETLIKEFDWEKGTAKKLWCFAPSQEANALFNDTVGTQFMSEIQEHVVSGMQQSTWNGALCGEPVRGIQYNLTDVKLHSDSIHRGGGQVVPASRRVCYAAQLGASPVLQERVFLVSISCQPRDVGSVYGCLQLRKARICSEEFVDVTSTVIKSFLPVARSFSFTQSLREATGARAFANISFDHFKTIEQDVYDGNSELHSVVIGIRKRKGMNLSIPRCSDFSCKL